MAQNTEIEAAIDSLDNKQRTMQNSPLCIAFKVDCGANGNATGIISMKDGEMDRYEYSARFICEAQVKGMERDLIVCPK